MKDEPRYLDVCCIYNKTLSAHSTESCAGFHEALEERDGTCIITDQPAIVCKAVHYYPHSKGNKVCHSIEFYLLCFSHLQMLQHLSRVVEICGGPPDLTDVNDVRNGLLLYHPIYKYFGLGIVGFLKVTILPIAL